MSNRPVGDPKPNNFQMVEEELPSLKDGQILVENHYLSLDPYMRGRMRDSASYMPPLQVGEVMTGETVGVVIESKSDTHKVGDVVSVHGGWRTHTIASLDSAQPFSGGVTPANTDIAPMQAWVGTVGMPARTAYFGLLRVGKPQAGETLVVSSAAGAVGSVVGQMGKALGLRVIGVAGGKAKCDYVKNDLGFDEVIDYKNDDIGEKLDAYCPKGIDIYFENVGGDLTKEVSKRLNAGARVPICGFISQYSAVEEIEQLESPFTIFGGLATPPEHRFFLVTEWQKEWLHASEELGKWIKSGEMKVKEWIVDGFENAPESFMGLLKGKNFGKALIRIKGNG